MKWILIYVIYSHTPESVNSRAASLSTTTNSIVFEDQAACYAARDGINSGAFNKSFADNSVTSDAACVAQSSTNGPLR